MSRFHTGSLALAALLFAAIASACGGDDGPPRLTLQWTAEDSLAAVSPTEPVKSRLIVSNDGGKALENVSLRFDQNETGDLPFGVTVGTVTNVSSRFDGDHQVWDLGRIEAGQAVAFPMTLWFEATSRTAEPLTVRLMMLAGSPALSQAVESNVFEVLVDTRQAAGR